MNTRFLHPSLGLSAAATTRPPLPFVLRLVGLWRRPIEALLAESERWFQWIPVLVGIGIALYFSLPFEPAAWAGSLATAILFIIVFLMRRRDWKDSGLWIIPAALLAVALGFAAAQLRTATVTAPILDHEVGPTTVTGSVVAVEPFTSGLRLTLDQLTVESLSAAETPEQVRLRLRGVHDLPQPGNRLSLTAVLTPLGSPTAPGAFDFQRYAFYQRLGAVGYGIGAPQLLVTPERGVGHSAGDWIGSLRMAIASRIRAEHNDAAGAIITALLVGETTSIPNQTLTAVRDAGLAHLLSISGVHIGMVAGMVFFWVRLMLAAIPRLALRIDAKKVAAIAAILAAAFYATLAGNSVPTQRSLLMLTVVMIGVIVHRRAISMRLLAWAALVILLTQPEALLGASFQMSFAAMVALIAAYDRSLHSSFRLAPDRPRAIRRTLVYVASIIGSSLVATLATAPFAIFHFNRLALLGVISNIIAIPLTGFWILPWGILALMLMPFGGESVALTPMAWGAEGLIKLAEAAAAIPGAAVMMPTLPVWGLALLTLGGLWLALWRKRWRLAGLPLIALGFASMLLVSPPDILVEGRGKLFGVRLSDGSLALSSRTGSRFARTAWRQQTAQSAEPVIWSKEGSLDKGRLRCDSLGCVVRIGSQTVAFPRGELSRIEDCRNATLIVVADAYPRPCPSATRILDEDTLDRRGAHAVWLTGDAIRIESVNAARGERPWVRADLDTVPGSDD